jgi:tRNA dimethylallyltransferase
MSVDAVLIAGPTASGKSAAALALAERIGGALINADSMQVYREAHILTARPDEADMARVPHLLYGHVSVHERYDVARYAMDAAGALREAQALARVPIFVGGTGLYFAALTDGIPDMPRVPETVRAAVRVRREELGPQAFYAELSSRDPETASQLRAPDTQRVLRAYEVLEATGRPLARWQRDPAVPLLAGLRYVRFVLSPPRAELHRRIEARFDAMLDAGAIAEAERLRDLDPALPSAKILGLRELNAFRAGATSLEEARNKSQSATRQYAKRQVTWLRQRMKDWQWIESVQTRNIISEFEINYA